MISWKGFFCSRGDILAIVYIKIHVISGNKEESVVEREEVVYVSVREKARQGAANRRMLELLRAHLPQYVKFRIVNGHHSPHKIVSIDR